MSIEPNLRYYQYYSYKMLIHKTCNFTESKELSEEDSFLTRFLLTWVVDFGESFRECPSFAELADEHFSFPWISSGIGGGGELSFFPTDFPVIVLPEVFAERSIMGSDQHNFLLDVLLMRQGLSIEVEVRELNSFCERDFDRSCLALLTGKSSVESLMFSAFLLEEM